MQHATEANAPIVYYISSHGYGHGTRSCNVIRALRQRSPHRDLLIASALPAGFLAGRIGEALPQHQRQLDVGLVQHDSVRADLPATRQRVAALAEAHDALVARERDWLQQLGAAAVVCDIPSIPITAAKACGIPGIAIGNFSWDWIYRDFAASDPVWETYADIFARDYAQTDLLLELPFSGGMDAFPRREPLPLPAHAGANCREALAHNLGLPIDETWLLIAFTALDLDEHAANRLGCLTDVQLLTMEPLDIPAPNATMLKQDDAAFSDLIASCDLILSKPGFGIVSDCIANDRPLIYTDRDHFVEYPILVAGIERHLRHAFLPSQELYAGNLGTAIADALSAPPGEPLPLRGAEMAARRILELAAGSV